MNKTHVIVTFSKTYLQITEDEYNLVLSLKDGASFKSSDGQVIKGSAIAELITIEEFYTKFPDKRPARYDEFKVDREEYSSQPEVYSSSGVIAGLRRFCDEHPEALKAKKLLEDRCKDIYSKIG